MNDTASRFMDQPPNLALNAEGQHQVSSWLDALEARMGELCPQLADALWDLYTKGEGEAAEALEPARVALYAHPPTVAALGRWQRALDDGFRPDVPHLDRRIAMLHREFLRESVRASIADEVNPLVSRMSAHRATLQGETATGPQLAEILATAPERDRRERAWRARAAIGQVVGPVIQTLAKSRSALARAHGRDSFYELGLYLADLEGGWLDPLLAELEAKTDEAWGAEAERLRALTGTDELMPWDLGYDPDQGSDEVREAFPGDALRARALSTLEALGLPLSAPPLTLDLGSRPGKTEHAFCFPVSPPGDIRVTASRLEGIDAYETLLHELGHAVYAGYVRGPSFVLRDSPNDALNEGVAQLTASLVSDRRWLSEVCGMRAEAIEALMTRNRRRRLLSLRWSLVWVRFEQVLYLTDGPDPTEEFWDLCERMLHIRATDELRTLSAWARQPHFASHPVYLPNYLVADLVAAQLREALEKRHGGFHGAPGAGAQLTGELFAHGATMGWQPLLERVTGAPLGIDAYVARWLS